MKYEYGLSIEVSPGSWKRGTLTLDGKEGETEEELMDRTKAIVESWFAKSVTTPSESAPSRELPTINVAHERLLILIEKAPDLQTLHGYGHEAEKAAAMGNVAIRRAYTLKFNELSNK